MWGNDYVTCNMDAYVISCESMRDVMNAVINAVVKKCLIHRQWIEFYITFIFYFLHFVKIFYLMNMHFFGGGLMIR